MMTTKELKNATFDIAFEWMLSDGGDGWATIVTMYRTLDELEKEFNEWNILRGHKLIVTMKTSDQVTYARGPHDQESITITTNHGPHPWSYTFFIY